MLTIFATPKPFRGHWDVIQRNAIKSWTLLHPSIEVILFGDEEGAAEVCKEYNIRHEPLVRRTTGGAKYLDHIFAEAQRTARHPITCYVNADIILLSDFMKAVEQVASWRNRFLMVGRRTNLDVDQPLDFESPDWEGRLRRLASEKGIVAPGDWIDFFVFTAGLYPSLPPFALGGPAWDNWLIWRARSSKAPVVDASAVAVAIHQNHDYSHHPQGLAGARFGEEALANRKLAGADHGWTLEHANYKLTTKGVKWYPRGATWPSRVALLKVTGPIRQRLGLRRDPILGLMARLGLKRR